MVAERGDLPGVSASYADSNETASATCRADREARPPRLARRGRGLAQPDVPVSEHDWGYDVADYRGVHPELGTARDLEQLIAEAGRRGIRVLLDLVPNHTSNTHRWFRDPQRRDWYVWRDPQPDGSPPNNWLAAFGGIAWTLDSASGQYYLHNFLPEQPDLDWWNEDVRAAFDEILRLWFDRGVAGFRIDVAHALVKDRALRDNPPARTTESPTWQRIGQWPKYNIGLPEAIDVHRRWRRIAARVRLRPAAAR